MKKIFFAVVMFCLLSVIFVPGCLSGLAKAKIVTCDGPDCTLDSAKGMLLGIYDFIVLQIATPLAVIAITAGAILMMISAGDPGRFGLGKKVLWAGIIGLVLALGSKAIINFILDAIGAKGITV